MPTCFETLEKIYEGNFDLIYEASDEELLELRRACTNSNISHVLEKERRERLKERTRKHREALRRGAEHAVQLSIQAW